MNASQLAHPLDAVIPDPAGKTPLCGEEEFGALMAGMVADNAPRLFAVVQEYGERVDGCIAAWGMAFEDRAVVSSVRDGTWLSLETPERAAGFYAWGSHIHAHLVWVAPAAGEAAE